MARRLATLIVEGPFNEEGIVQCNMQLKDGIKNRPVDKWKILELWDDEVLGSFAVIAIAKEQHQWYIDNGCICSAIVISNNLQESLLKSHINSSANIFTDVYDAKDWLAIQG